MPKDARLPPQTISSLKGWRMQLQEGSLMLGPKEKDSSLFDIGDGYRCVSHQGLREGKEDMDPEHMRL
jgi:hypothetical protein